MNTSKSKGLIALGLLALILVMASGCHGRSENGPGAVIMNQTPSTPRIQANQQAQSNNPRLSPQMREMLRQHVQQSH